MIKFYHNRRGNVFVFYFAKITIILMFLTKILQKLFFYEI